MVATETLDVLAISPHADDVEMCCGGTLAKLADLGHRVGVLDLTRGELASNGTPEGRLSEATAAAKVLGLVYRENLGLPDGFVANALSNDGPEQGEDGAVAQLVGVIRTMRPRILIAPPPAARHPDHVAASRLVDRAVFFAGVRKYPAPGDAGPHRPARVMRYLMRVGLAPSFVVDVTAVYERKRRAVACYGSQVSRDSVGAVPTMANAPRSHSALEARDHVFGGLIGVERAEGFDLDGTMHIDDPVAHFGQSTPAVLFQDEGPCR